MKEYRRRKTPRLRGYDYSQSGSYFITICTKNREHLFGEIENGIMVLNEFGTIAEQEIKHANLLRANQGIQISEYVIMPNHVHFIVRIVGTRLAVSAPKQSERFSKPTKQSIPSVIRSYKSAVTKIVREIGDGHGKPCPYEVWQSRYHDHIIRDEQDYAVIARYIAENPSKWIDDCFYC